MPVTPQPKPRTWAFEGWGQLTAHTARLAYSGTDSCTWSPDKGFLPSLGLCGCHVLKPTTHEIKCPTPYCSQQIHVYEPACLQPTPIEI